MSKLQRYAPYVHAVYMKIAPPRRRRLIYFAIYILLGIAAVANSFKPPASIVNILGGMILVYSFLAFVLFGAIVCLLTVLQGFWLFERIGLVSIGFGIVMYTSVLVGLGASPFVTIIPMIMLLLLALRGLDISEYMTAPTRED